MGYSKEWQTPIPLLGPGLGPDYRGGPGGGPKVLAHYIQAGHVRASKWWSGTLAPGGGEQAPLFSRPATKSRRPEGMSEEVCKRKPNSRLGPTGAVCVMDNWENIR